MAIETIHEAVLTRLLDNKELRFTLRTPRANNEERLAKGYWFSGNEGSLSFSFWEGGDSNNKTSNIIFVIAADGKCFLEFVDTTNSEKARFFEEIASIIGLSIRNPGRFHWQKKYSGTDYTASLKEFLEKDKPIIDAFIQAKGKSGLFPAIAKENFDRNLNNVLSWRQKRADDCDCSAPVIVSIKQVYPIRLKKVILDNIGHFKQIELNLDQQVTCLIGENGSGKTSILRGIALGLAGVSDNTVIDPNNEKIRDMLRINKIDKDKEIFAARGYIEVVYNDNQEKNILNFEYLSYETPDSKGKILKNIVQIDDTGSDLKATEGNNFSHLVLGFSQTRSTNGLESKIMENDTRPRISEVTNLIYDLPDDTFENFSKWILSLWDEKSDAQKRPETLKVLEDIFNVIQQVVGGTFELMPMEEEQKKIFIKTNDAPEGISLGLISQGYSNIIGWVGYFMQRLWEVTPENNKVNFKQTPAICLIDEIDTYLHPKWEQKILSVLAAEFPNTQFVVTTHSPIVISNLKDNYRIYSIEKNKDLMQAFEHNNTKFKPYGAESSRILSLLMQFEERPEPIQKLINGYQQAILDNDFELAERFENQLKNQIDSSDPVLVEGEASIEARKMLQEL